MKPQHYGSPFVSPMVTRNVSAVTGACLAVSKATIEKIGGFDEKFIVCGSDIELALRANQHGLVNIYDPNVRLYHYESKSRDASKSHRLTLICRIRCIRPTGKTEIHIIIEILIIIVVSPKFVPRCSRLSKSRRKKCF